MIEITPQSRRKKIHLGVDDVVTRCCTSGSSGVYRRERGMYCVTKPGCTRRLLCSLQYAASPLPRGVDTVYQVPGTWYVSNCFCTAACIPVPYARLVRSAYRVTTLLQCRLRTVSSLHVYSSVRIQQVKQQDTYFEVLHLYSRSKHLDCFHTFKTVPSSAL